MEKNTEVQLLKLDLLRENIKLNLKHVKEGVIQLEGLEFFSSDIETFKPDRLLINLSEGLNYSAKTLQENVITLNEFEKDLQKVSFFDKIKKYFKTF